MQDESSVYARAPIMLYWEATRACDLACTHCRAEAIPFRDPQELTTAEAKSLLRQIVEFGDPMPHLVCTGGDPLMRPDLMEIVREAVDHGLRVSIAPSGTSSLTREVLARLKQAGVQSLSLSLDGSTPFATTDSAGCRAALGGRPRRHGGRASFPSRSTPW